MSQKKISVVTATNLVVANMVGTGVFTSLGFQVAGINSDFALIALWVVGGVSDRASEIRGRISLSL
jgi:APA family basic amino acid/polyamine antiporter